MPITIVWDADKQLIWMEVVLQDWGKPANGWVYEKYLIKL
jgi:hypothetical protein